MCISLPVAFSLSLFSSMNFNIPLTQRYYFLLVVNIFLIFRRILGGKLVPLSKTNILYIYYTILMKNVLTC